MKTDREYMSSSLKEPTAYICEFYADPGEPFLSFEPIRSGTNIPLYKEQVSNPTRDEWDIGVFINNHVKESRIKPVYGFCPFCDAPGVVRERRPNGDDKCLNGHVYPSALSKKWSGLTDEEIQETYEYKMALSDQEQRWLYRLARTIEAKLREKNGFN